MITMIGDNLRISTRAIYLLANPCMDRRRTARRHLNHASSFAIWNFHVFSVRHMMGIRISS